MSNQIINCKFWNIKNNSFVYTDKCKEDTDKKIENKQGENNEYFTKGILVASSSLVTASSIIGAPLTMFGQTKW